jgi:hypothetical protein
VSDVSKTVASGDPDDTGLVSAALIEGMLCVDCIARRTGVPAARVDAALATIGQTVKVGDGPSLCSACRTTTRVFHLI